MRPLFTIAAVALVGCSDTVKIDGVEGLPTDSIAFSISAQDQLGNSIGGTTTVTAIILSDREDLCDEIGVVGGLDAVSDVFAVQLLAINNSAESTVDSNSSSTSILFDPNGTQGLLATRVLHRVGGETVFEGASLNLIDPDAVVDGKFGINSVSSGPNGTTFGGTYKSTLAAERSDPSTFDTDWNADGIDDYERLSAEIRGRFAGARSCDALRGGVDVPDADPDTGAGGECDDESFANPNPSGQPFLNVEFGEVCAGGQDRMTYNVESGCTTRLDVEVPDAFDDNGNQVRDVSVGLFFAGGGGTSATSHTTRRENEFGSARIYLEGGGDSLGAVTVRIGHQQGAGAVPYTLNTVVDCP